MTLTDKTALLRIASTKPGRSLQRSLLLPLSQRWRRL